MKINTPMRGARISIRNYEAHDLQFCTEMWFDEENGKYLSDPTREYADDAYFKILHELQDSPEGYYLIVESNHTKKPIGTACMFPDESRSVYDIGYCICQSHWRQGYGSEMLALLLEWLRESGANTVMAEVAEENIASCALLEKFGFAVEKQKEFKKYRMDVCYKSRLYSKSIGV